MSKNNGHKRLAAIPSAPPEISMSAEHSAYVAEMSARTGLPPSTVLKMLLDLSIHRLQFMGIESVLSPAALRMAYGIGKAPPPAPPPAEKPEASGFDAQESLRRQQISAGLLPGPECPGCKAAKTEIADPKTLLLRCRATCGWEG